MADRHERRRLRARQGSRRGKRRFAIHRQALHTGNLPERGVLLVIYCVPLPFKTHLGCFRLGDGSSFGGTISRMLWPNTSTNKAKS
jgi:hypothetical protein